MQGFLRRLLNVQPGEGRKLTILYVMVLVIGTALAWGESISMALFLNRVGVEWLPLMFILSALLTFPVGVLYTAFVDRSSNARLLTAMFAILGVVLLACWTLLLLEGQGVAIPYAVTIYGVLYLAGRVQGSLFSVHAWTLFNDYYDLQAAKRAFPVLGSAARVAAILAAPVMAAISLFPQVQGQDLILAWVAVMAVGTWYSFGLPRWLDPHVRDGQRPRGRGLERGRDGDGRAGSSSRGSVATYWKNLRDGLRFVSASTFLKLLALGAFAMTALLTLVNFEASAIFEQTFGTDKTLIIFYSVFQSVSNLIALPVQMILLSRLVSRVGVGPANLVYPLGNLISYTVLTLWPSLGTALIGQFSRDTFRAAVHAPVDNMLYNAVPAEIKGRARAFIRGLLMPLAEILLGLGLMLVVATSALPWWLLALGWAAALTHVLTSFLVRRRYTKALVTMLEQEDFSAYRLAGSELGPPDPATFQRLVERMRASEDKDYVLFLAQVVAEVGGREAPGLLLDFAEGTSPAVQAGILEIMVNTGLVADSALALSRQALSASDSRLRRAALAALERLMGAGNPDLWPLAAPLLDDADPETRLPAILLLVRSGDFFYLAEAVGSLQELLSDEDNPAWRVAGLRVLQVMGDARMVRNVARYLDDPDDRVRLQAAQAIETLVDPEAPDWTVTLAREAVARELEDPVEAVRLSGLRTLGSLGGEMALDRLRAALADPSDLVRDLASREMLILGQEAAPALEEILADKTASEQTHQAAAVALGWMARDRLVGLGDAQRYTHEVEELFEETLRRIYADEGRIAALINLEPVAPQSGRPRPASKRALDPGKRARPARGRSGLDALLPAGSPGGSLAESPAGSPAEKSGGGRPGRRRGQARGKSPVEMLSGSPAERRSKSPAEKLNEGAAGDAVEALAPGLLRAGLRQRNERRLADAFQLLGSTRRDAPATVDVIARTLCDRGAEGRPRASALEALESLTLPRVARLVGNLAPFAKIQAAELQASGQEAWGLESTSPEQALQDVLAGQDRWLAAIGIVVAGETRAIDARVLRETWLPQWQADPVRAVRQSALYTARQYGMETDMIEATQAADAESLRPGPEQNLSAVERAIFLKQVPFFASMTVEQLRTLAGIAEEQYCDEEQIIYAEGDPGEALYVVVSGRVGIERTPGRGQVRRLETLTARRYTGERSIFDGAPHENRAVAVERAHLLIIRREPLLALIRRSPDLSLSLVAVLSQSLREADAKLAAKTRPKADKVMKLFDQLTADTE